MTSLVIAVVTGLVVLPHGLLHHHDLHPALTISYQHLLQFYLSLSLSYLAFIRNCQYFPSGHISFLSAARLGSHRTVFPAEGGPAGRKYYHRDVRDVRRDDPRDDRRDDQPRWR